jgi:hypothetical protein
MASRYTRDEIISQALDLAHSPTVSAHDSPEGVLDPNAWTVKWLENALNFFHRLYPFSSDVTQAAMTVGASSTDVLLVTPALHSLYLPDDFIVDIRNGLFFLVGTREVPLRRVDYQRWLKLKVSYQNIPVNEPLCYTLVQKRYKIIPMVSQTSLLTAHYFALPVSPGPDEFVDFPDEQCLIDFLVLRILEHTRARNVNPGTAQVYLRQQLAGFKAAGLLGRSEYEDGIPLENAHSISEYTTSLNDWMGKPNG